MVYSTCTLTAEENEDLVRTFLEEMDAEWELAEERYYPAFLINRAADSPETWPDSDASYCALLRKTM